MSNEIPNENLSQTSTEVTHDKFFAATFRRERLAGAFLKAILPPETSALLDFSNLVCVDRHLANELYQTRIADVIYRVPIKKSKLHVEFFAVLEHKSYNDPLTIIQLWGYVQRICAQNLREAEKEEGFSPTNYRLPPVIAVIVHHGESAFSGKTQLSEMFATLAGIESYLPRMEAILVDLNRLDEIPSDPEVPELKAVLTILKAVFQRDVGKTAAEVFADLQSSLEHAAYSDLAFLIWLYLVNSAENLKGDYDILPPVTPQKTGDRKMPTMVEIWRAEGRVEGRVEEGLRVAARSLIRILKTRFRTVPPHIEQRITEIGDLVVLESLTELAVTCATLAEFEEALR